MKKCTGFLLLVFITVSVYCQEPQAERKSAAKKFASELILYNDLWQGKWEQMSPRTVNQGLRACIMYNIPVEKSALLFSVGTGFSTHNLFSDALFQLDSDNVYQFSKIEDLTNASGDKLEYKKSKLSVTYWDFPFEFRYEAKKGFRIATGMTFGFVVNSMTKYKGDDLSGTDNSMKLKIKSLEHLEKWRYGLTGKIGYKAVELFGFYSFTKVFKEDKAPELWPVSVGINLRLLMSN